MPSLRPLVSGLTKLIAPAEWRLTSALGRVATKMLRNSVAERKIVEAEIQEAFTQIGIFDINGKWLLNDAETIGFLDGMRKGIHYAPTNVQPKVKSARDILNKIWKDVYDAGGTSTTESWVVNPKTGKVAKVTHTDPIGYLDNYFPNYFKKEVGDEFIHDSNSVFRQAAVQTDRWNYFYEGRRYFDDVDLVLFDNITANGMAKGLFNQRTQRALDLLINRDGMSPGQAMLALRNRAMGQKTNPFAILKHGRQLKLPQDFYEESADITLKTYVRHAAKHISELRVWGNKYENWNRIYQKLNLSNPAEASVFKVLTDMVNGTAEYKYGSEGWKKFSRAFMAFESSTKIGLGTAFIPNITQHFISTIPKAGIWRFARGLLASMTPRGIKLAHMSGFGGRRNLMMQMMAGMPDDYYIESGLSKILHNHPGMRLFNFINKTNNIVSATTGEIYLKDMYKRAGKGSKWAIRQLNRYGINHRQPLDDKTLHKGIYRFVTDLQLQRDILKDPLWMNDPRTRIFGLFKRFGLRQSVQVLENVIGDLAYSGNVLPLLRMAAGGAFGGLFVVKAKAMLQSALGGDPTKWSDEDQGFIKQLLYAFSQVGALGWLGDLVGRMKGSDLEKMTDSQIENLFFQTVPLIISDPLGIPGSFKNRGWLQLGREIAVDAAKDGINMDIDKHMSNVMIKFSPLTAYVGYGMKDEMEGSKKKTGRIIKRNQIKRKRIGQ